MAPTTYGSCFAGIGGIDLGLDANGVTGSWVSEVDRQANAVLAARLPHAERVGDIVALAEGMFPPSSVDVLAGGPPCQDLSKAGKRAGLDGSRSGLFFPYLALVEALRPTWVVMEQVTGLVTSNGGADLATVLDTFASVGYHVAYDERNSLDHGVPQRRRRLLFVAHADRDAPAAVLAHGSTTPAPDLVDVLDPAADADEALYLGPKHAEGIVERVYRNAGAAPHRLVSALEAVIVGASPLPGDVEVFRKGRRPQTNEDGETWVCSPHANTLNLNDVGVGRATSIVVTAEGRPRILSPVEQERCHGFPDGWTEPAGSHAHRYRLLGNAVSPPVAARIAAGIVACS